MPIGTTLRRGVVALLTTVSVCALAAVSTEAVAQSQSEQQESLWSWDWGGEKKEVASSGRKTVSIANHLKPGEIFVSFSDRRLYFITKPGEADSYPIAIPRQQDDWKGVMLISDKKINPSWTPTPTMIKENPRLPSWVPGGHPYNPLGVRALYLGSSAYRIHGTDAPWTIGEPVSKGCIRMYNKDVVDLYEKVKIGTRVTVTWDSFNGGPVRKPYDNVAAAGSAPQARDAYAAPAPVRSAAAPAPAAAPAKETKEQAKERERLEKAERERAEKAEKEAARERGRSLGSIFGNDDVTESWTTPQERAPRAKQQVAPRKVSDVAPQRTQRQSEQ